MANTLFLFEEFAEEKTCSLPFFEQPKNENEQLFNLQVAFKDGDKNALSQMFSIGLLLCKKMITQEVQKNRHLCLSYEAKDEKAIDAVAYMIEQFLSREDFVITKSFVAYLYLCVKKILYPYSNDSLDLAEVVDTDEKLDKIAADYDFTNDDEAENRKYDDLIFEYKDLSENEAVRAAGLMADADRVIREATRGYIDEDEVKAEIAKAKEVIQAEKEAATAVFDNVDFVDFTKQVLFETDFVTKQVLFKTDFVRVYMGVVVWSFLTAGLRKETISHTLKKVFLRYHLSQGP